MRVLCDCDGVIFDPHVLWARKYQKDGGGDEFRSLDDIKDWKYLIDLLGEDFLKEYFTPAIVRDAPLNADMCRVIEHIKDNHSVQFVTDVPNERCQKVRKDRLMNIFGVYEHEITFVGLDRVQMDADVLIDDRLEACVRFAVKGGKSILVSKPWNQSDKLHPNVYRAWGPHDIELIMERIQNGR